MDIRLPSPGQTEDSEEVRNGIVSKKHNTLPLSHSSFFGCRFLLPARAVIIFGPLSLPLLSKQGVAGWFYGEEKRGWLAVVVPAATAATFSLRTHCASSTATAAAAADDN